MRDGIRLILLLWSCLAGMPAHGEIYHCDGAFGEPSFSNRPCRPSATQVVPGPAAAQVPGSGLRASERAWLQERARRRTTGGGSVDNQRPAAVRQRERARQQDYRCRQKRRALEKVKQQLRRGYRPAEGERLRRRRGAYRDYLAAFCP